jgi:hypothetical protein
MGFAPFRPIFLNFNGATQSILKPMRSESLCVANRAGVQPLAFDRLERSDFPSYHS